MVSRRGTLLHPSHEWHAEKSTGVVYCQECGVETSNEDALMPCSGTLCQQIFEQLAGVGQYAAAMGHSAILWQFMVANTEGLFAEVHCATCKQKIYLSFNSNGELTGKVFTSPCIGAAVL